MTLRNRLQRVGLALMAGLIAWAARLAAAGDHHGAAARQAYRPAAPYVVYRPAFEYPNTKPLFLGGYAGTNYGRGPRASYAPAGYLADYNRPPCPPTVFRWRRR
ncbi:MAG: hypothetical protein IRY99_11820 [Isosphaeraceae bacterium]|nr:hypothetical protein [Isosphaeraceae bacterium]